MFREPYLPITGERTLFKDTPASSRTILETAQDPQDAFRRICAIIFVAKRGGWDHSGYTYLVSPNASKQDRARINAAYSRLDRKWREETGWWISACMEDVIDTFGRTVFKSSTPKQRKRLWTELFEENPAAIAFKCFASKAVDVDFTRIFNPDEEPSEDSIEGRWRARFLQVFISACEDALNAEIQGPDSDAAININCGLWLTFHPNRKFCNLDDIPIKWQNTVDWDEYRACLCSRTPEPEDDVAVKDEHASAGEGDNDAGEIDDADENDDAGESEDAGENDNTGENDDMDVDEDK